MHISVGIEKILSLERRSSTPVKRALVASNLGISNSVDAHTIRDRHDGSRWRGKGVGGLETLIGDVAYMVLGGRAMRGSAGGLAIWAGGEGAGRREAALICFTGGGNWG